MAIAALKPGIQRGLFLSLIITVMKKIPSLLLLIAIVLISLQSATAQISVGPKGGINLSNLNNLKVENTDVQPLVGFHLGAFASFRFGPIAVVPELLYSTQGAKLENATNEENLEINYFNIPVMLRYYTKPGFFLETGPQLGFNTSAKLGEDDIKQSVKESDFSWCAGIGFQKRSLGIGVRYNIGLSKTGDAETVQISDVDYKNGVLQVSLFFTLFGAHKN
jgi:hypothetical protein